MTLTRCDSLGYLAVTVDSRAVGGVDLHVVVDTGVHGGGLVHRHALDTVGTGGFAVGGHQRIALNSCPQSVQVRPAGLPTAAGAVGEDHRSDPEIRLGR
jgi:hypothetical protein